MANALVAKVLAMHSMNETISEEKFSSLLACIAKKASLPPAIVRALSFFVVRVGTARSLELKLILSSSAAYVLLPLATALQKELGQKTQVAKEVEEVARDLQRELAFVGAILPRFTIQ